MRRLPHILLLFLLLAACTSKSQYEAMRRGMDAASVGARSATYRYMFSISPASTH